MRVWDEGVGFKESVLADADITGKLDRDHIDRVFDSTRLLENVDYIFGRVFDDTGS